MSLKSWLENRLKKSIYNRWVKVREGVEWAFVHPWEKKFVEQKLEKGWSQWTSEETRELTQLMFDLGKRVMFR